MAKTSLAPFIAGLLTAGLAAIMLPTLAGSAPLLTKVVGAVALVFFGYLFFRSARNWEVMLAEMRRRKE
jgi:hypothetical protein